jgi:hypothetical protein
MIPDNSNPLESAQKGLIRQSGEKPSEVLVFLR